MKIFARARNMDEARLLRVEGVTEVLPETVESSFMLGHSVLSSIGISENKIENMMTEMRENNYAKLERVPDKR